MGWSFQLNLELTWSSSQLNRLSSRWRILGAGEGEEAIKGMRGRPTESEDGVGKRSTWRSCQLHLELTWRSCQLNLELTWSFQLNLELTWSSSQLNRLSSRWRILDAGEGEEAIKGMRGRPTESEDGVGKRSTWRSCQLHLELTW